MHSVERLRYVARTGRGVPPGALGAEAGYALAELSEEEPAALVPACRRLLGRQTWCGPLWWVAARVLMAVDPYEEGIRSADLLEADPTQDVLQEHVPPGARRLGGAVVRADVGQMAAAGMAVVEATALGEDGMVLARGLEEVRRTALELGVELWVVAGEGRVLPPRLWSALVSRVGDRWPVFPFEGVDRVVIPAGVCSVEQALATATCPEPPALLGGW